MDGADRSTGPRNMWAKKQVEGYERQAFESTTRYSSGHTSLSSCATAMRPRTHATRAPNTHHGPTRSLASSAIIVYTHPLPSCTITIRPRTHAEAAVAAVKPECSAVLGGTERAHTEPLCRFFTISDSGSQHPPWHDPKLGLVSDHLLHTPREVVRRLPRCSCLGL